ncbi:PRC-barrel domain-containing protein [Halomonas sp. MA07-2]|uniref:PRC-barrel domain-containing protein n=1 Tax=Halomonas sp. MA07-2 TaxID=3440841 RepID=UPI003EEF5675
MKKKLISCLFSAIIVPTLALGTAVIADDRDDVDPFSEHRTGGQPTGDQHIEEQRAGMVGRPAGAFYIDNVIGKTLKHRESDEDVGEIEDLLIGEDGRIIGIVVTTGTFLGLGGQDVGLSWDRIVHILEDDEPVFYTDVDEESLRNSPEFVRD